MKIHATDSNKGDEVSKKNALEVKDDILWYLSQLKKDNELRKELLLLKSDSIYFFEKIISHRLNLFLFAGLLACEVKHHSSVDARNFIEGFIEILNPRRDFNKVNVLMRPMVNIITDYLKTDFQDVLLKPHDTGMTFEKDGIIKVINSETVKNLIRLNKIELPLNDDQASKAFWDAGYHYKNQNDQLELGKIQENRFPHIFTDWGYRIFLEYKEGANKKRASASYGALYDFMHDEREKFKIHNTVSRIAFLNFLKSKEVNVQGLENTEKLSSNYTKELYWDTYNGIKSNTSEK